MMWQVIQKTYYPQCVEVNVNKCFTTEKKARKEFDSMVSRLAMESMEHAVDFVVSFHEDAIEFSSTDNEVLILNKIEKL